MLTEDKKSKWQKRIIIFKSICEDNNIEVTNFMEEDFIRVIEEMSNYDNKIHSNSNYDPYWGNTKKKCFDWVNIFLASKEYIDLRNTYPYLKLSCLDYTDKLINKVEPKEKSFKHILSNDFLQTFELKDAFILKVIIPLIYSFINYSIISQVEDFETKNIVINIYDFINYMLNV